MCNLFRLHSDQSVESAAGEVGEIIPDLLEGRRGRALLRGVYRGEVELGLPIPRRLGSIEVGVEARQLGVGEADLRLALYYQREVGLAVVFLEGSSVFRRLVDHGDDCGRCARARTTLVIIR